MREDALLVGIMRQRSPMPLQAVALSSGVPCRSSSLSHSKSLLTSAALLPFPVHDLQSLATSRLACASGSNPTRESLNSRSLAVTTMDTVDRSPLSCLTTSWASFVPADRRW